MKIAVTYDKGMVGEHFGHAEAFKVYDIDGETVNSVEVVEVKEQGHDVMANFIDSLGVDVLICGGIGERAQEAVEDKGIVIVSGASGDADIAVVKYIAGEIDSEGANCNCGGDCGSGCGGGCGGCGGGCGGCGGGEPRYMFEGENVGKACRVHYKGTFDDGEVFDSSYERNEPIQFICGVGMMIPGFDKAVANMKPGDVVDIHLDPEDAYGPRMDEMILTLRFEQLPGSEGLTVGEQIVLSGPGGQPFPVKVVDKSDETITLDANHEMAGKTLNFHIEMVEILEV